jgi:hypothetical protein
MHTATLSPRVHTSVLATSGVQSRDDHMIVKTVAALVSDTLRDAMDAAPGITSAQICALTGEVVTSVEQIDPPVLTFREDNSVVRTSGITIVSACYVPTPA